MFGSYAQAAEPDQEDHDHRHARQDDRLRCGDPCTGTGCLGQRACHHAPRRADAQLGCRHPEGQRARGRAQGLRRWPIRPTKTMATAFTKPSRARSRRSTRSSRVRGHGTGLIRCSGSLRHAAGCGGPTDCRGCHKGVLHCVTELGLHRFRDRRSSRSFAADAREHDRSPLRSAAFSRARFERTSHFAALDGPHSRRARERSLSPRCALYAGAYALGTYEFSLGGLSGSLGRPALDFFYFAAETYSTLGYGDLVPVGALRLIASVESLNGLLLLSWSGAFLYGVLREPVRRAWHERGRICTTECRSARRASSGAPARSLPGSRWPLIRVRSRGPRR